MPACWIVPSKSDILNCMILYQKSMRAGSSFRGWCFANEWAASNGSCRSVSFVRFLRSRLETIFFRLACRASAVITGCVQDASYACKKRTPHSLHFRFDSPPFPVALYAAKSLPALMVGLADVPRRMCLNVTCHSLPVCRASDMLFSS